MTIADRWLLPDGVDEVLPERAQVVEYLRRQLLDLYQNWGYDLVIPPMVEFTDSLLSGSGSDLDLMTFRITDQLSGRMMGIRADITPQTAVWGVISARMPIMRPLSWSVIRNVIRSRSEPDPLSRESVNSTMGGITRS